RASLAPAMKGVDAVIHNAAVLPPAIERFRELGRSVNVEGTQAVIDAMKSEGVEGPLVFSSSVSVHGTGFCHSGVITGETPLEPSDAYTEDKAEAEARVRASGLDFVILRVGVALDATGGLSDLAQLRMIFEVDPEVRAEAVHGQDVALAQA